MRVARQMACVAAVLMWAGVQSAYGQVSTRPSVFTGIRELSLDVSVDEDCRSLGVDSSAVRLESELALRRMGLRVTTEARAELMVWIQCSSARYTSGETGIKFYSASFSLREWVFPLRLGQKHAYSASTWEVATLGYASPSKSFGTEVTDAVKRGFPTFENEWLKANPKR